MKINDTYEIKSDNQFILVKNVEAEKKDTGEKYIREVTIGYYADIETLLKAYLNRRMMDKLSDEDTTIKELLEEVQEVKKEIDYIYERLIPKQD